MRIDWLVINIFKDIFYLLMDHALQHSAEPLEQGLRPGLQTHLSCLTYLLSLIQLPQ